MLIKTISDISGPKGNSIIHYLMQDQPRKMTVVGVRGLYSPELTKAQNSKKDFIEMKQSYEWIDGDRTKSKLDGTCALEVTNDYDDNFSLETLLLRINATRMYGDCGAVGILVSEGYSSGEDDLEIIMGDARLICAIMI